MSTLYLLTYLITTTTLCGRSALIHGIYDLSKKGDPARSHPVTATVRSPCPIAASCSFTWEAKLYIGDSAELRVRELGLNPGSASSLLCFWGPEYLNYLKCSFLIVPWELKHESPWTVLRITWENICRSAEYNPCHLGGPINIGWINGEYRVLWSQRVYGLNCVPSKIVYL